MLETSEGTGVSMRRGHTRTVVSSDGFGRGSFERVFGAGAPRCSSLLVVASMATLAASMFSSPLSIVPSASSGFNRLLDVLLLTTVPVAAAQVVLVRAASAEQGRADDLDWHRAALLVSCAFVGLGVLLFADHAVRPGDLGIDWPFAVLAATYIAATGLSVAPMCGVARSWALRRRRRRDGGRDGRAVDRLRRSRCSARPAWGAHSARSVGELVLSGILVGLARPHAGRRVGGARSPLVVRWRAVIAPTALLRRVVAARRRRGRHGAAVPPGHRRPPARGRGRRRPHHALRTADPGPGRGSVQFARGGELAREALRLTLRITAALSVVTTVAVRAGRPVPRDRFAVGFPVPRGFAIVLGISSCVVGLLDVMVTYHCVRGPRTPARCGSWLPSRLPPRSVFHSTVTELAVVFALGGVRRVRPTPRRSRGWLARRRAGRGRSAAGSPARPHPARSS